MCETKSTFTLVSIITQCLFRACSNFDVYIIIATNVFGSFMKFKLLGDLFCTVVTIVRLDKVESRISMPTEKVVAYSRSETIFDTELNESHAERAASIEMLLLGNRFLYQLILHLDIFL